MSRIQAAAGSTGVRDHDPSTVLPFLAFLCLVFRKQTRKCRGGDDDDDMSGISLSDGDSQLKLYALQL